MAEKRVEQCIISEDIKKQIEEREKNMRVVENEWWNEIREGDSERCLVIRIDGWLGRVIAMSGAITWLAKKRPVKVITSRPLVFWGNPYIKSVHWLDDRDLFENVIKGNDYYELEPYTDPWFFNDAENWLSVASRLLKLDKVYEPQLFLAEHEKMNNYLEGEKVILYQPFGSTMMLNGSDKSYRSLPVDVAQNIAMRLNKLGYTLYEVIKPWAQPVLNGCRILDTPDLRFVVSLCDRYPVVGCDSSLHHASKAFGKKALVMWAGTDKERYGYDSNINMREYPFKAFTPMRLPMNSFDLDIANQGTNKFSDDFIREVVKKVVDNFYK